MKFSEPAHPAVVFLRTVATLTFVILLVAGIALLAKSASAQSAETQRADVVKLLTDRASARWPPVLPTTAPWLRFSLLRTEHPGQSC